LRFATARFGMPIFPFYFLFSFVIVVLFFLTYYLMLHFPLPAS